MQQKVMAKTASEPTSPSNSRVTNEIKPVEKAQQEEKKTEEKPLNKNKTLDRKGIDRVINSAMLEIPSGVDGVRKEELTNILTEALNQSTDRHQLFNGADQLM